VEPLYSSERTSTAIGFGFINFDLEYLKRFTKTSNPPTSSAGGLYGYKPQFFHQTGLYKCGKVLGLRLMSRIFEEFQHPAIQTTIEQHFGKFF
jgi:hypothetical protein